MTETHLLSSERLTLNSPRLAAECRAHQVLHGSTMGTTWSAKFRKAAGKIAGPALEALIQAELALITQQMSTWIADSTISCLNRAARGWYQLPDDFFHVLKHALDLAKQSAGAYDPTVGKLVDLWGFGPAGPITIPPSDHDIAVAQAQTGWHRTALDLEHRAVWQPGGLLFDLSSIAKGYGVDRIASILEQHDIEHYLIEVGGELKARGLNPEGSPWTLAIEIPAHTPLDASHGKLSDSTLPIALSNCAIATSGDYRRYFQHRGRRYAHTLNSLTGVPVEHNLVSVSVLHPQCMVADALATALLSLGPERGIAYAHTNHVAALFMLRHADDLALEWTAEFRPAIEHRNGRSNP